LLKFPQKFPDEIKVLNSFGYISTAGSMARVKISVIPVIIALVLYIGLSNGKDTLQLGVLVSRGGEMDNSGFLPALDLALETVNNDTSL